MRAISVVDVKCLCRRGWRNEKKIGSGVGEEVGRGSGGGVVIRNRTATIGMTGFFIPPLFSVQRPRSEATDQTANSKIRGTNWALWHLKLCPWRALKA